MNNIPTAKEFCDLYDWENSSLNIPEVLKNFAKLHVKAALEAAAENAQAYSIEGDDTAHMEGNIETVIVKKSILNAYPDELIK